MNSLPRIGRYELRGEIGRGGMAIVYRAYDPNFEREVAIKVLLASLADPNLRRRFEREARTIARLEHSAIVPVYDYGEEAGQPYLVMRLMVGGTLTGRIKQGQLSLTEIGQIVGRIGAALDEAHQQGLIHRDLKPGNILFDQYGQAYLSDFGIVRLAESEATLTGLGVIGTPGYMSPEQIQGLPLDGRSDIYSLGVVLFEMLAGQKLFEADTPAMLLVKQMTAPPTPVGQLRPDTPPDCKEILNRALAKEREERPATANELAAPLINLSQNKASKGPTPLRPEPDPPVTSASNEATVIESPIPATIVATPTPSAKASPHPTQPKATSDKPRLTAWLRPGLALLGLLVVVGIIFLVGWLNNKREEATRPETTTAVTNQSWLLLMTDSGETHHQIQHTKSNFPTEFITQQWAAGFDVTSLAYSGGVWGVIMTDGGQNALQIQHAEATFPTEFISKQWANGFDVTSLAYGDGVWGIIMTNTGQNTRQIQHTEAQFPQTFIDSQWNLGFDVSSLTYGDGVWALIMTNDGQANQQILHTSRDFPSEFIQRQWDAGYDISHLAHGNGLWGLIMAKVSQNTRQLFHPAGDFPQAFIVEKWTEGFDVTGLITQNNE